MKNLLFTPMPVMARMKDEKCVAFLLDNDDDIIVSDGMQGELIYWFSQKTTQQSFSTIFNAMEEIYDVDPSILTQDLEQSLNELIQKKIIIAE